MYVYYTYINTKEAVWPMYGHRKYRGVGIKDFKYQRLTMYPGLPGNGLHELNTTPKTEELVVRGLSYWKAYIPIIVKPTLIRGVYELTKV